jgi:hypothetical protein
MIVLLLACAAEPEPVTFSVVQSDVFTASCAFSSCHGSGGGGAADLDLSEGMAYAELVDVAAVDAPDEILVIPGDSASSYLVKKSAGDASIIGDPMPAPSGLEAERLQLLKDWIDAGALDD